MVRIDVYADVVCPWCYIGEKRLEKALVMRPDLVVTRRWRPFQLRSEMPAGGLPWPGFAREKFGGEANARAAFGQVAALGAEEGIHFDFGRVASAPNTVDAHRLILHADDYGLQWETTNSLFHAYFAEGANLNDPLDLTSAAGKAGLDTEEVRNFLSGSGLRDEVWQSQEKAGRIGVGGVPFYIFDGRHGLSGAQPVEVFVQALDALRADLAG
ncbi:MAG: DsbA family oxidoreductase [Rubrobacteraceae bacterium]